MQIRPRPDPALLRDWSSPEISPLAAAVSARRRAGLPVHDFITSHPYDYGIQFNPDLIADIFAEAVPLSARYAADPLGQYAARESIAKFHSPECSAAQVLLTPGTSMAYFYLFRLLARAHGEVLCPAPTYPLFDDLAKIAGLKVRRYHLERQLTPAGITRWAIDPEELAFQVTPHTSAIVLVSPHNPTGTITNAEEMAAISEVANWAGIPIIHDEVFRSYTREANTPVPRPDEHGCNLSIVLNGLSKSHYLPGIKAGWLVAQGCIEQVNSVMNALEYMADSFLPVQEQTQAALPRILSGESYSEVMRLGSLQRERLDHRIQNANGWNIAIPESGPYMCARLESDSPDEHQSDRDEMLVQALLAENGALFHPGHLYAYPDPWLVSTVFNPEPWPAVRRAN